MSIPPSSSDSARSASRPLPATASSQPPVVALVGRVNVGKSTLFNRILEDRRALISQIAGTTRDRIECVATWRGRAMRLVDSGGVITSPKTELEHKIVYQTERAIEDADVIVFVVDSMEGLHAQDTSFSNQLRRLGKPVIVCANKSERREAYDAASGEFERFGFPTLIPVSAFTGSGVGDLLDAIVSALPASPSSDDTSRRTRITFIGKPNVGKSSLVNGLLNDERVIVTELPHTTRESQDIAFTWNQRALTLVDTAGIHPIRKIRASSHLAFAGKLEERGIEQSARKIPESDVVVFVIEAHGTLSAQDYRVADLISTHPRVGVVVAVNKVDLLSDRAVSKTRAMASTLHRVLPMFPFPPVVFTSATSGYGMDQLMTACIDVTDRMNTATSGDVLSEFRKRFARENPLSAKATAMRKPVGPPILLSLREVSLRPRVLELTYRGKLDLPKRYIDRMRAELYRTVNFAGISVSISTERL